MRYYVTFPGGSEVPVEVSHLPNGELSVSVGGQTLAADLLERGGATSMRLDGQVVDLWMEGAPPSVGVVAGGKRFYAKVESEQARALSAVLGPQSNALGEG